MDKNFVTKLFWSASHIMILTDNIKKKVFIEGWWSLELKKNTKRIIIKNEIINKPSLINLFFIEIFFWLKTSKYAIKDPTNSSQPLKGSI